MWQRLPHYKICSQELRYASHIQNSPGGNPIKLQNSLKIFVLAKTIFVLVLAKSNFFLSKSNLIKKYFFVFSRIKTKFVLKRRFQGRDLEVFELCATI